MDKHRSRTDGSAPDRSEHGTSDALSLAFVLAVTAVMLFFALDFVSTWGSRIPVADDLEMACFLVPGSKMSWPQLWAAANEHRIVLPRLVFLGLLFPTRDFRSPLFFQVWTHAVLVLGMVFLVRKLRGRTRWTDAFFPLFWLSLANAQNFLLGMQIATDLSVLFACGVLALFVWSSGPPGLLRCALVGLALLLLPLNGGFGLTHVPSLALLAAGTAWWMLRTGTNRRAAWCLVASLVLLAVLVVGYFHGLRSGAMDGAPIDLGRVFVVAGQVLTLNLGPAAHEFRWPAALLTAAVVLSATALALHAAWRLPGERRRALTCLAVLAAPVTTAIAIGVGRGAGSPVAGWADRYVTLPSVLFATAFVIFVLYGKPVFARAAEGLLFSVFLILLPIHVTLAEGFAALHAEPIGNLFRDARSGTPIPVLAERYEHDIYWGVPGFQRGLEFLAAAHMPPFDQLGKLDALPDYPALRTIPVRIESRSPPSNRFAGDEAVLLVEAPSCIHLPLRPDERSIRGQFGIPDLLADSRRSRGLRVVIELVTAGTGPVTLLERILVVNTVESDRKPQAFELELPAHAAGEILLRTQTVDEAEAGSRWSSWSAVEIR